MMITHRRVRKSAEKNAEARTKKFDRINRIIKNDRENNEPQEI